jgi:hypothetical protein
MVKDASLGGRGNWSSAAKGKEACGSLCGLVLPTPVLGFVQLLCLAQGLVSCKVRTSLCASSTTEAPEPCRHHAHSPWQQHQYPRHPWGSPHVGEHQYRTNR